MPSPYLDQPIRSELQACVERLEALGNGPEDLELIGDRCVDLLNAVTWKVSSMLEANGAERLASAVKSDMEAIRDWIRDEVPDLAAERKRDMAEMYRAQSRAAE